ncbi:hypothetical protein HYX70_01075 [Candidatus Saccharibacteria bacterium]|nr:hypothetical protein [Candidatus Saccharibacteria bacterium]
MQAPDYFLALIKQYANLTNEIEAKNIAVAITNSLYMNLNERSRQQVFAAMPHYLWPKRRLFGHKLSDIQGEFEIDRFVRSAMIQSGLTDENELKNSLKAYFKTLKILSSRDHSQLIADYLPASLARLYSEC